MGAHGFRKDPFSLRPWSLVAWEWIYGVQNQSQVLARLSTELTCYMKHPCCVGCEEKDPTVVRHDLPALWI